MGLVVRNGTLVGPRGRLSADVVCEGGRVAAIAAPGTAPGGSEEVDATGLLVFPGFIDPHVHSRDPGFPEKEDFAHSTRAAAAGGVTTVLEMPNTVPPLDSASAFRERAEQYSGVASVDFGLWGLSLGAENLEELSGLVEEGTIGVKLFWGYALDRETKQLVYSTEGRAPEDMILPPDNGQVLAVFETMARAGGLLAAHCEDRDVLEAAGGRTGEISTYQDLLESRPDTAEAATISLGAEFARATGCRFHVVHTSSSRGLDVVRAAQRRGVPISAETCPQYLTLTNESFEDIGPLMKVYPPVRYASDRDALWEGIEDGTITSVGSDHAPHTVEQKQQQDLGTVPAGAVGVETLAPLMVNEALSGRISAEKLAWVLSEGTARLYGLYPRKGAILPGSDADLTLVDPGGESVVSNERLHSKQPASPWDGTRLRGSLKACILRGQVAMRDGELLGGPRGRLVRPFGSPGKQTAGG